MNTNEIIDDFIDENGEEFPIYTYEEIVNKTPGLKESIEPKSYWATGTSTLPHRLRGVYGIGVYGSTSPEFGWMFSGNIKEELPSPIRFEAAHRIEELERDLKSATDRIADLEYELEIAVEENDDLENELYKSHSALSAAENEVETLEDRVDELEDEVESLLNEVDHNGAV